MRSVEGEEPGGWPDDEYILALLLNPALYLDLFDGVFMARFTMRTATVGLVDGKQEDSVVARESANCQICQQPRLYRLSTSKIAMFAGPRQGRPAAPICWSVFFRLGASRGFPEAQLEVND